MNYSNDKEIQSLTPAEHLARIRNVKERDITRIYLMIKRNIEPSLVYTIYKGQSSKDGKFSISEYCFTTDEASTVVSFKKKGDAYRYLITTYGDMTAKGESA